MQPLFAEVDHQIWTSATVKIAIRHCSDCGRRQVLLTPTITMRSLVMARWHRREWPVYEIYGDREVPDMSSPSNVGHGC
jgi:hypothetical protein